MIINNPDSDSRSKVVELTLTTPKTKRGNEKKTHPSAHNSEPRGNPAKMISIQQIREQGEDVFQNLVHKLVTKSGRGPTIPSDACVQLTMLMYGEPASRPNKSTNHSKEPQCAIQRRNTAPPIWLAEHPRSQPLVKPLCELMPLGLRLAVATMSPGEKAHIWIDSRLAYGSSGLYSSHEKQTNSNLGDDDDDDEDSSFFPFGPLVDDLLSTGAVNAKLEKKSKAETSRLFAIEPDMNLVYAVHLVHHRPKHLTVPWTECGPDYRQLRRLEHMSANVSERLADIERLRATGNAAGALGHVNRALDELTDMPIDIEKEPEREAERIKAMQCVLQHGVECAMQAAQHVRALTMCRRLLHLAPDDHAIMFLLGRISFSLGNADQALRYVRRASLSDPGNERYQDTLREIEFHVSLIDSSYIDPFELKEDYEELADIMLTRIHARKKALLKDVNEQVCRLQNDDVTNIVLRGGFPAEFLDEIYRRCKEKNPDITEVVRSADAVEIKLPSD